MQVDLPGSGNTHPHRVVGGMREPTHRSGVKGSGASGLSKLPCSCRRWHPRGSAACQDIGHSGLQRRGGVDLHRSSESCGETRALPSGSLACCLVGDLGNKPWTAVPAHLAEELDLVSCRPNFLWLCPSHTRHSILTPFTEIGCVQAPRAPDWWATPRKTQQQACTGPHSV